jgi:hypothetical protein
MLGQEVKPKRRMRYVTDNRRSDCYTGKWALIRKS